jgi:predicted nucleotidyltransferase
VVLDDVTRFGRDLATHLEALLRTEFVGAYFVGSIALGGYVPGESDVDIVAVSARHVVEYLKCSIGDELLDLARTCPARGLEFTLYRRASLSGK